MIIVAYKPRNNIVWATIDKSKEEVASLIAPIMSEALYITSCITNVDAADLSATPRYVLNGTVAYYTANQCDAKCMLLFAQCKCLDKLETVINTKRLQAVKSTYAQDAIYAIKVQQALKYLSTGVRAESNPGKDYPYIQQYSIIKGISLEAAVQQILDKHTEQQEIFLETEYLRLSIIDKVVKATSYEEAMRILHTIQ